MVISYNVPIPSNRHHSYSWHPVANLSQLLMCNRLQTDSWVASVRMQPGWCRHFTWLHVKLVKLGVHRNFLALSQNPRTGMATPANSHSRGQHFNPWFTTFFCSFSCPHSFHAFMHVLCLYIHCWSSTTTTNQSLIFFSYVAASCCFQRTFYLPF